MSSTPSILEGPFAPVDGVTPRIYLDLSTSVLPQDEMESITAAPVRVVAHEYGAWVHVPPDEFGTDPLLQAEDGDQDWGDYPNLQRVLIFARTAGAWWVNIDCDGYDTIASLPTFTW